MTVKLPKSVYKKINAELAGISREYHPAIPLTDIFGMFESRGLTILQEDGSRWEGLLCGEEGRMVVDVADVLSAELHNDNVYYKPIGRTLMLSWYKMPRTGNYEITAYVS